MRQLLNSFVTDDAPDGADSGTIIYETDANGLFISVNAAAVRFMQCAEEQLLGRHYLAFVPPAEQAAIQDFYLRQTESDTVATYYEFPVVMPHGAIRWLGQHALLKRDNDGAVAGFKIIAHEITARRAARQALELSEARYRLLTDTASDAILTIDARSIIRYVNRSAEQIFGYGKDELIGAPLEQLMPERMRDGHAAGFARYLTTGTRNIPWQAIELPARHKDGREFPIEISFGEYHSAGERFFTAIIRDISDRKAAQAALLLRDRAMAATVNGITITDATAPDNPIIYINPAFEKMTGYTAAEVIGRNCRFLQGAESDSAVLDELRAAIRERKDCEVTLKNYRKDGTPFWNRLIISPVFDAAGQATHFIGVQQDITQSLQSAESARQADEYRKFFRLANDPILILTLDGEIVLEANDRACALYGVAREDFIGRSLKDFTQDVERGEQHLQKLAAGENLYEFETVQHRADGTPLDLLITSSMIEFEGRPAALSFNRDITERKRAQQQLWHNALHDALTGLPNRALFLDHLQGAMQRDRQRSRAGRPPVLFAVLFLDFDRFKVINDSLGYLEGDKLLVAIARRLAETLRPGDVVARSGGDEFIILLNDLRDTRDALRVAERLNTDLNAPFKLDGHAAVTISTSIGIAFSDKSYAQPEELLRDADIAMYRAKATGKARYQVFDQAMHREATLRLQLETELRRALDRREFCLHYQPIIELGANRLSGFEALVRWQHPTRGLVLPSEFIALTEETGLIVTLGEWVLREACRQTLEWQQQFPAYADLTVNVNLSCKQFMQNDLPGQIARALADTQLLPQRLRLEITESLFLEDMSVAALALENLRALGVELSIDDFGTGYSNLSYLHRLPVSQLKIDRSFVTQMQSSRENGEIVRTICALAKNLGMRAVAEGVEDELQLAQLRELGCEYGQGYLFSKPVTAAAAAELLAADAVRAADLAPPRKPVADFPPDFTRHSM